jgi:transcriptional regulator with XRE-family HTH domain
MKSTKQKNNISAALKLVRTSRGMSQEDFSIVSSRTYVSTLERGLKSPTLGKLEAIAEKLDLHPLTLLVIAYAGDQSQQSMTSLFIQIQADLDSLKLPISSKP